MAYTVKKIPHGGMAYCNLKTSSLNLIILFLQRLFSIKSCLPSKVVLHVAACKFVLKTLLYFKIQTKILL